MTKLVLILFAFSCVASKAQLIVTVSPPQIIAQKTIVSLAMTNNFSKPVESARAICFLMDEKGEMVGQSAKWVIVGSNDRQSLPSKNGTTYNFVMTTPNFTASTNLSAKVSFTRIVLEGGKLANPAKEVTVTSSQLPH